MFSDDDSTTAPELRLLRLVLDADAPRWGARWKTENGAVVLRAGGRRSLRFTAGPEEIAGFPGVRLLVDSRWAVMRRERGLAWADHWRWWAVLAHVAATAPGATENGDLVLRTEVGALRIDDAASTRGAWSKARLRRRQNVVMRHLVSSGARPSENETEAALSSVGPDDDVVIPSVLGPYLNAAASRWGASWIWEGRGFRLKPPTGLDGPPVEIRGGPEVYVVEAAGVWYDWQFSYEYPDREFAEDLDDIARVLVHSGPALESAQGKQCRIQLDDGSAVIVHRRTPR